MASLHERRLRGLVHLGAVTSLSQRNGLAHPTAGPYEATDLQYWWRAERPTDDLPQPVWFDDEARPAAAVVTTAWPGRMAAMWSTRCARSLDPLVLPDASPDLVVLDADGARSLRGDAGPPARGGDRGDVDRRRDPSRPVPMARRARPRSDHRCCDRRLDHLASGV
ncbi:MAG: hypothetical protein R2713_00400 [Ilumatobacteraceae bacterium]